MQIWNPNNCSVYYKPLYADCAFEPIIYPQIDYNNAASYNNTDSNSCVKNTNAIITYQPGGLYQEVLLGSFIINNGYFSPLSSGPMGQQFLLYNGTYLMTFKNVNVHSSLRMFNVSISVSSPIYTYTYNQLPSNWMTLIGTNNFVSQSTQDFSKITPLTTYSSSPTPNVFTTSNSYPASNLSDTSLLIEFLTIFITILVIGFLIKKYRATDIHNQYTTEKFSNLPPAVLSENAPLANAPIRTQTIQGTTRSQFCSVCGEVVEPGDNYCANCGARLQ